MQPAVATHPIPIHRLSVAQYEAMGRTGILTPDDRVELLEGWLVEKMTKNPPHRIATREARLALESAVPPSWYVETQEPIVTADSEPEPDVAVIRGRTQDYANRNPPADQTGLVVEIADATVEKDRVLKGRVYARARIPAYWFINLVERHVEV
jgi:Uma2 family endonuclease